jgi:hypothetical protein
MKQLILNKIIQRKFEKISKLEKEIWENVNQKNIKVFDKYFVNSQLFACIDGFVLIRYFNEIANSFSINLISERIGKFKKHIPIISLDKKQYIFPINLGFGGTVTILGTLNSVDFGKFQIKVDSTQNLDLLNIELEEFLTYFKQDRDINELKNRVDLLINQNKSLNEELKKKQKTTLITEGKTDWQHFIKALDYFHLKNEFLDINADNFLKYGEKKDVENNICGCDTELLMSNTELVKSLNNLIVARKLDVNSFKNTVIGLFDSDTDLKMPEDSKQNIYSIEIEPKGISTELLYQDYEIKTLVNNRRLYIGLEFDNNSKRHISENLTLGGNSNSINKAGKNCIIDDNVFDSNHNNVALSKSNFSNAIFNSEIAISDKSWENFRPIFDKISNILNK